MKPTRLAPAALLVLLHSTLTAQHMPEPAPELQKLNSLAGHWQGSGTVSMAPGTAPVEWTAASIYQWVLGNFWLQCDTTVDFGGAMPNMRLREYYGWDSENKRYVSVVINNQGEAILTPMHLSDGQMVMVIRRSSEGPPLIERARTKFTADTLSMSMSFIGLDHIAADAVVGTFKRVPKVQVPALPTCKGMGPAAPQMAPIHKMVGVFDGTGEMIMVPGQPATKIAGRDTATTLFDGNIVMVETKSSGEGPSYESVGFWAWSIADDCHKMLAVDNMGMVCSMDGYIGDGTMVCTFAGRRMGQPCAARMVMTLDKDGAPSKLVNHSSIGTAPPAQDFVMTYTRVK